MKLRRRFSSALRPMLAHRLRAVLALSGVAVGVAAVVVSRSVGVGAQAEMERTIGQMGTNLLIIKPLPVKRLVARPQLSGLATTLRIEDSDAIAQLPTIREVAPAADRAVRVKLGTTAMRTMVRGTTPAYLSVRGFELAAGRCFDEADNRATRRVAVLGASVAAELGRGRSLVGEEIRVGGVPFQVIGVLQPKGSTIDGADQDNHIVVPLGTALRRVLNSTWLTTVYARVTEPERMDEAEAEVQRLLRERHQRGNERTPDDFAVQNTTKTRAFQQEMMATLSRYAGGLAAVALVVGGLGILALMLLSVRERTSEIGLRMAVGAEPRDILIQFLIEAMVLALAGWAGGALLGGAAAVALGWLAGWPVGLPVTAIASSLAIAVVIGLGFGALPARNAARIPPIDALVRR
jgi:putative ABC transport system permease protein